MSRPRSDFPSYRKHTSGQAIVTLTDPNGRRQDVLLGEYGTDASREEYDRQIQAWVARGRTLDVGEADELSNNEVLARFVWENEKRYDVGFSAGQVVNLKAAVNVVRELYGMEPAKLMSPKRLKTIRKAMVDKGWTLRRVNQQISRVKSIYRWAVSEELIPGEVIHSLQAVRSLQDGELGVAKKEAVKPVPEEVIEQTLPHLPAAVRDIVRLMLLSGARCSEICILRPCDIDRSGEPWTYRPSRHKTKRRGKERFIYFAAEAQEILSRRLVATEPEGYVFSPAREETQRHAERSERRKTKLWKSHLRRNANKRKRAKPKNYGPHYLTHTVSSRIVRVCDRLDAKLRREKNPDDKRDSKVVPEEERLLPRWSVHQIRHTAGTRVRKMFGVEVAQLFLGHEHLSTIEIYAEPDREAVKKAVSEMG